MTRIFLKICIVIALSYPTVLADNWTHYAGNPARTGSSDTGPVRLDQQCWVVGDDQQFIYQSSPVVVGNKVIALGLTIENSILLGSFAAAYRIDNGQEIWKQPDLEAPSLDSLSSPAVDIDSNSVFVVTGRYVYRLDLDSGLMIWPGPYQLDLPVVNASPVVAEGKVYITDFSYTGPSTGKLYAINIADGQLAWYQDIGKTIGSTAAYWAGKIYAANNDQEVFCFNADNGTIIWQQDFSGYPLSGGFSSGLAVNNGSVYAATYNFNGGQDNSMLVKLSAHNGTVLWTVNCERTRSIPIAVEDKIYLAGGIDDYGSAVKLECFVDNQTSAAKLWETTIAGGWTHQPAYSNGRLYVGRISNLGYSFDPSTNLFVLDATKSPTQEGFVIDNITGCGGSMAVSNGRIFTLGAGGLFCLKGPTLICDLDGSGTVDWGDFSIFADNWLWSGTPGQNLADFDSNGTVNWADFAIFSGQWLASE